MHDMEAQERNDNFYADTSEPPPDEVRKRGSISIGGMFGDEHLDAAIEAVIRENHRRAYERKYAPRAVEEESDEDSDDGRVQGVAGIPLEYLEYTSNQEGHEVKRWYSDDETDGALGGKARGVSTTFERHVCGRPTLHLIPNLALRPGRGPRRNGQRCSAAQASCLPEVPS
mmetsp:Transcript_22395/g.57509  ORF Transcript_22395/g.57509 Transcript_22395/m.57509 type:complete len:171 (-) Transcript_22395:2598-3110(-)